MQIKERRHAARHAGGKAAAHGLCPCAISTPLLLARTSKVSQRPWPCSLSLQRGLPHSNTPDPAASGTSGRLPMQQQHARGGQQRAGGMAAPPLAAAAASWARLPPATAVHAAATAVLDERCLRRIMPPSKEQLEAAAHLEHQLQGAAWCGGEAGGRCQMQRCAMPKQRHEHEPPHPSPARSHVGRRRAQPAARPGGARQAQGEAGCLRRRFVAGTVHASRAMPLDARHTNVCPFPEAPNHPPAQGAYLLRHIDGLAPNGRLSFQARPAAAPLRPSPLSADPPASPMPPSPRLQGDSSFTALPQQTSSGAPLPSELEEFAAARWAAGLPPLTAGQVAALRWQCRLVEVWTPHLAWWAGRAREAA